MQRNSRAVLVQESLDIRIKWYHKDIDRYDAFFGEE